MSSKRIHRENQVIIICDLREFASTISLVTGGKNTKKNTEKADKFYSYMDFYLKSVFELFIAALEFITGKTVKNKGDIMSNLLFNSTGDGAVLVIGGNTPENVIGSYVYSLYLDYLLKNLCEKLEKEFKLPKLKRRVGIALAFGEVTAVQYRYKFPGDQPGNMGFFHVTSLISEKINIAARVESLNKDHINADISLDSSFVDELYRFMYSEDKIPRRLMKNFKKLKTKQERLAVLNQLNSNDIDLLINYLGHHYFKGGDTVVHIVSPVLVEIELDLKNKKIRESEELRVFYMSVNERMERDVNKELVIPLQNKLLHLLNELQSL